MKSINKGDQVKMNNKLKSTLLLNGCEDHVIEFGDCVGIVEDKCYPDSTEANEVNVRWNPSGLRYAYFPNELKKIKSYEN